jgi:hypothetical protein
MPGFSGDNSPSHQKAAFRLPAQVMNDKDVIVYRWEAR